VKETHTPVDGTCEHDYTIVRRWVVFDNCGLSSVNESIATVVASHPTISGVGEHMNISCDEEPPLCEPTLDDPCDYGVEIEYHENITDGTCLDEKTLVRTWSTTNNCGNTVSESQTINYVDDEPPRFISHPPKKKKLLVVTIYPHIMS
jgi:hypothetical protein